MTTYQINKPPEEVEGICNNCAFYQPTEEDSGDCHALPPTIINYDGELLSLRPSTMSEDIACSNFEAL